MDPLKLKQGSEAWQQYRIAKVTGSRVKDMLDFTAKGEPGSKRKAYMAEIVSERLTGLLAEHYVSPEMRWGTETESLARSSFESRTRLEVDVVGISQHPTIAEFCASADGFISHDGVAEFKCPKTSTHISWMLANKVPEEHTLQCYAEMACSGRDFCEFASFDPRLPLRHQLFMKTLYRNDEIIGLIEDGVRKFLSEVDALIAELNARNPEIAEPAQEIEHAEDFLSEEELDAVFGRKA